MTTTEQPLLTTAPAAPREVAYAIRALFVVAAIHLVALALVITHHDVLIAAVAARHPDWSAGRVDQVASSQFRSTLIPHIVLPIVFVTRARALRSGRRRTRTIITALLGLQLLAHATLPLQLQLFPGYGPWIIGIQAVSLVFEASTIYLLWRSPRRAGSLRPHPIQPRGRPPSAGFLAFVNSDASSGLLIERGGLPRCVAWTAAAPEGGDVVAVGATLAAVAA